MSRAEALFQELVDGREGAIDELVAQRTSEELFLDFKRAATKAEHRRLHEDDRRNLAKALSGFGNTAGGVIIWGVDCRNLPDDGDIARTKFPIPQVHRFKSWLETEVAGATVPSHVGVQHAVCHTYPDDSGFVATLIPVADHGPLQVPSDGRYMMRAASSFVHIPHQMLAGMFGRRPTPQLTIAATVNTPLTFGNHGLTTHAEITVVNSGLGIAQDLFIAVRVDSEPVPRSVILKPQIDGRFDAFFGNSRSQTRMSRPDFRFPPGSEVFVAVIELHLAYVASAPLQIVLSTGCANGPTAHQRLHQNEYRLKQTQELFARSHPDPLWLAKSCFGLEEDDRE